MKKITYILTVGFAVIGTIGLGTFIGIKTGHTVIGIVVGFVLAMAYLFYSVVKK